MRCSTRALIALTAALSFAALASAVASPVTAPIAVETAGHAEDGHLPAPVVWWLPGPSDTVPDEGVSHESSRPRVLRGDRDETEAGTLVLGLFQVGRISESVATPRPVALEAPEAAADSASSVARTALRDGGGGILEGGLVGLANDRHHAFLAEAHQWVQSLGDQAGADDTANVHDPEGRLHGEGRQADRPQRERLIPPALIDFLREYRLWIFGFCVAVLSLMLSSEVMRKQSSRRGGGTAHRRSPHQRRSHSERRAVLEPSLAVERRAARQRRSMSERRSPQPAVR